jgi:hypothetical protein
MFFGSTWNNWVFKGRYVIVGVFTLWIGMSCFFAGKIGPLTKPEEFIPSDHPSIKSYQIMANNFTEQVAKSEMIKLKIIWGLKDIDRTGDNAWDPEFVGKLLFDDDFNPATVEN